MMIVSPGNVNGFDAHVTAVDKPRYCEPNR